MRNIKRFTLLILIINFVIWTLFAINKNNLWYWIISSLSINSAIILYAYNKNIRIIAKSFKHKDQVHVIPSIHIVIEPNDIKPALTFDFVFWKRTSYISFYFFKKPQNNSICHCINYHPPLISDQGKKAKCSYCGNFYNKQK